MWNGRSYRRGDAWSMFRIGDFSKFSRVSVKMLRHYDERGLLTPAWVDPATDYRYYSPDQLPRLNRIIALKDLGFTLEQIRQLLDDDVPGSYIHRLLLRRRTEIAQEVRTQQARLAIVEARLEQFEREGALPAYEVVLRTIAPQLVAAIRMVIPTVDYFEQLFVEVEAFVDEHKARAAAPPLTVYYDADYREQDIDVEVAVPLLRVVPRNERVIVRELPGVTDMACVIHTGSYATIDQASHALFSWIGANGFQIDGPSREVYVRFSAAGSHLELPTPYLTDVATAYVTELQVPVRRVAGTPG